MGGHSVRQRGCSGRLADVRHGDLYGPSANPVGQVVRVGNTPFTICGVASKKGQSATGQDYDDAAFIPSSTFAHRIQGGLGKYLSGQMYVQATSSETTDRALADRDLPAISPAPADLTAQLHAAHAKDLRAGRHRRQIRINTH